MNLTVKKKRIEKQKGFSLPELMVVVLILAILAVLALPQINASRRVFRFSGMQRQLVSTLVEARQEAMSQRTPITFQYDNKQKQTIIYGGSFGAEGDAKNKTVELTGSGLEFDDLKYRRLGASGNSALADGTNETPLNKGKVEITFQPDGSVINASNNPENNALFFFHKDYRKETAFAVSILGAGGRVKIWKYNNGVKGYVE